MTHKVFVEDDDTSIKSIFLEMGWDIVDNPEDSDLICFTGGSDVSPMLYEMPKSQETHNDLKRDEYCCNLFWTYVNIKPMVGICRGGQFLNVMCGGELFQHVNHHNMGIHEAVDPSTGQIYLVTSAHHQMMIPTEEAEILLVSSLSTYLHPSEGYVNPIPENDIEAVFYEEEQCLCFQPHPEYVGKEHECYKLFFEMIDEYLGLES